MANVVSDFGADPTGATDSTIAIQNGINATTGELCFPAGTYLISKTLLINHGNITLKGENIGSVVITSSMTNLPTIELGNAIQYVYIKHMTLNRSSISTSGGDGITCAGKTINLCSFEYLEITNHYCGLNLGCTGYSYINRCFLHENYYDGIFISNGSLAGSCQWTIKDTLSQTNNGCGLRIASGNSGISIGEIINFSTFANAAAGIAVLGSSLAPVSAVRIMGGLIGADNGNGIYMDSYSFYPHKIVGLVIESAGTSSNGRLQSNPASLNSYGMLITGNNTEVIMGSCVVRSNTYSGIYLGGGTLVINNSDISYNGSAGAPGNQYGIYEGSGKVMATNNIMTGQQYALRLITDNHIITSNSLSGNSMGQISNFVPLTTSQIANNL